MPTRNISLTEHQDSFVSDALVSGRYQNASEVLRAGLRLLERREARQAAWVAYARGAVAEADAAIARGEVEEVSDAQLGTWLRGLAPTNAA